jgi:hypothetical protein
MSDAMPTNLEQVYDEQINPLMAQIIAICKEHGLPMVASFQYEPDSFCTSLVADQPYTHKRLGMACQLIREGFLAYTVTRNATSPTPS